MLLVKEKELVNMNSMRISATADYYTEVSDYNELGETVSVSKKKGLKLFVIGNGSNTLFAKKNYKRILFVSMKRLNRIFIDENKRIIECEAGVKCSDFINFCIKNQIEGFEFLAGIPGTMGGMVKMNAGAFGKEIGNYVLHIIVYNVATGKIEKLTKERIDFSYRKLNFSKENIITRIGLEFSHGEKKQIKESIKKNLNKRYEKQPKGYSFGSVFKNGKEYFAGELIEKAGLKGFSSGDAYISNKHANFIINGGKASGKQVLELIHKIESKVFNKFGILPEREVEIVF
jgi:UDP-N-acetylmuramate dehydrogenase